MHDFQLGPPGNSPEPNWDLLEPLDLDRVLQQLDELLIDRILAQHDNAISNAIDSLAKTVKAGLRYTGVWRSLQTLDVQSWPLETFQWSVFHVVVDFRKALVGQERVTRADVNTVYTRIQGIILPTTVQARPDPAAARVFGPSLDFSHWVAALQKLDNACTSELRFHNLAHLVWKALKDLRCAVPASSAWEELAVVKPRTNPSVTYQHYVLRQLASLDAKLRSRERQDVLEIQVKMILTTINEAKRSAIRPHALPSQPVQSLGRRDASPQLITAHRAARYGITPEDLARRWA